MQQNQPQFVGKTTEHLIEVDSTNSFLQYWASAENLQEGTVVTALFQNSGRGQRGTVWQSNAGENLLFSVLFYPEFLKAEDQFYLNMAIALAVHKFVAGIISSEEIKIKWPNDILVTGNKIAGILIENSIQGNKLKSSIAGIGININMEAGAVENATSVFILSGKKQDIKHFLPALYMALEEYYLKLKHGYFTEIKNEYLQKLYGLNKQLNFVNNADNKPFTGKITGIDNFGRLCVKTTETELVFGIKEISFM